MQDVVFIPNIGMILNKVQFAKHWVLILHLDAVFAIAFFLMMIWQEGNSRKMAIVAMAGFALFAIMNTLMAVFVK